VGGLIFLAESFLRVRAVDFSAGWRCFGFLSSDTMEECVADF
jgi:hypothetical protein